MAGSGAAGTDIVGHAVGSMNGEDGAAWCSTTMAKLEAAPGCEVPAPQGVLLWLRRARNAGDLIGHSAGEASSSEMDAHLRRETSGSAAECAWAAERRASSTTGLRGRNEPAGTAFVTVGAVAAAATGSAGATVEDDAAAASCTAANKGALGCSPAEPAAETAVGTGCTISSLPAFALAWEELPPVLPPRFAESGRLLSISCSRRDAHRGRPPLAVPPAAQPAALMGPEATTTFPGLVHPCAPTCTVCCGGATAALAEDTGIEARRCAAVVEDGPNSGELSEGR